MLMLPAWLVATQAQAADAPPPPPAAAAAAAPAAGTAAPADTPAPPSAGAPSPTGAPPADAAGAPAGAAGGDSGAYTVRLRSLEKNVNELKEQIFRTKARLNLLKETVLGGVIGASRAVIHHKNEMGSSFRLIKAAFALDGVQIAAKSEGGLADMQEFDVYNGAIQPGSHTLSVALQYQGNGFGVFSYLKGYKFNVKSSHTFVAGESKTTNITVVGYEKGNITTQLSDKPAIDFRVNVMSAGETGTASAAKK
jgi:hypothetical protein